VIQASANQRFSAGALAALVHATFLVAMVFSVSWRHLPELPVYADLWTELPPLPEPAPASEPEPEPAAVIPEPVAPPPPPEVKEEPNPDIALKAREEEERRRQAEQERLRKVAEAKKAAEEKRRKAEEKRQIEEALRAEEARRLAKEQTRQELEEALARQIQEDLAEEAKQARVSSARAMAQARTIADYQDRIRSKIRGYVRLPLNLSGNPEVVFQVQLLPDGEVHKLSLLHSSGQPAYDNEVERAILKASPFPLPSEREVAAEFIRDGLKLKHRAYDGEGSRS